MRRCALSCTGTTTLVLLPLPHVISSRSPPPPHAAESAVILLIFMAIKMAPLWPACSTLFLFFQKTQKQVPLSSFSNPLNLVTTRGVPDKASTQLPGCQPQRKDVLHALREGQPQAACLWWLYPTCPGAWVHSLSSWEWLHTINSFQNEKVKQRLLKQRKCFRHVFNMPYNMVVD